MDSNGFRIQFVREMEMLSLVLRDSERSNLPVHTKYSLFVSVFLVSRVYGILFPCECLIRSHCCSLHTHRHTYNTQRRRTQENLRMEVEVSVIVWIVCFCCATVVCLCVSGSFAYFSVILLVNYF